MEDKERHKVTTKTGVNDEILIIRLQGMFYNAYDDSAKVLSVLTGYKVKQVSATSKLKCGFPSSALDKNVAMFNNSHISFCIMNKEKVVAERYTLLNMYKDYLYSFDDNRVIKKWETDGTEDKTHRLKALDRKEDIYTKDKKKESFLIRLKNKVGKFL